MPEAFYVREGDAFRATELTRGPWSPVHQHAGPPSALLARALERTSGLPDGQTARLTVEILRPVPIAKLTVTTRVVRPGRRVELSEASLRHDGAELMRATAWRLRAAEMAAAPAEEAVAPPAGATAVELPWWSDEVAYHRAFEWRLASGSVESPGPACVWARQRVALVDGEAPTPLERLVAMADAASGVSWQLDWDRYTFPNVDLSLHLERPPAGEWTSMDAVTRIGAAGAGVCRAVLADDGGRVGTSTQTLLVEAR